MRKIKKIFVHCSYTKVNQNVDTQEIRRWHVEENGWSDIGYHAVVLRDGTIDAGRSIEIEGAHVHGHNHDSIGICLVGGMGLKGQPQFNYTKDQMDSLYHLLESFTSTYIDAKVMGHCDVDDEKSCPIFDVGLWWEEEQIKREA